MPRWSVAIACLFPVLGAACEERAEPPMRPARPAELAAPPVSDSAEPEATEGPVVQTSAPAPGLDAPIGEGELVSIATETSIYTEPRWKSKRLGYLRAGARVRRSDEPVAKSASCKEGWYRVEPRGYVCVGSMATLDLQHPVALASTPPPRLDGLPYQYVLSRSPTPTLYARLPTRREQRRAEHDLSEHLHKVPGESLSFPPPDPIPAWLSPGQPSLSLGNAWHAPDRLLLGRAKPRSGFALLSTFAHEGRRFGLTTGLELLALDRARIVKESAFAGLALDDATTLPIAFMRRAVVFPLIAGPKGLTPASPLAFRAAAPVTEETRLIEDTEYIVAKDGSLLRASDVVVVRSLSRPPAWALDGVTKWIDISISRQSLVAYEGTRPVYATLVSTGVGGTGDPQETHATVQGTFAIYEKHITVTMDGDEARDPFDLRDVPFVQYFSGSYALHATYWHDEFGRARSHGCVNLSPRDAAWLFRWTDPRLPTGWHGAMSKAGTTVYIHG